MGRGPAESKPETASEVADQISPASFQNFTPTGASAAGNDINCTTTCFPPNGSATFVVKAQTKTCILPGTMMHSATVTSKTPDISAVNNTAVDMTEVIDGSPCDDGNVCTTMDACSSGACVGGPLLDCNDGNVCTDETCLPGTGCKYTNNTNACDDANACTTADKCGNGQCIGGPPPVCNDGDVCTDDTCDNAIGCVTSFNTAPCEDGNKCTANDTCASGTCTAGSPVVCMPQNDCQENGLCDPVTGACAYYLKPDGTACNDGNACSMNDKCKAGACIDSTPLVCPPPANNCLGAGTCNPSTGSCSYPVVGGDLDGDGLGDGCDDDIDGDGLTNDEEVRHSLIDFPEVKRDDIFTFFLLYSGNNGFDDFRVLR